MPRKPGFHHSAETREKQRLGNLGKKVSVETRERQRQSHLGVPHPHEGLQGVESGSWKGDDIGYGAAHERARKQWRGKPCIGCGAERSQVALRHDAVVVVERDGRRYSPRQTDYLPLCVVCHNAYDRAVRPDYVETQARVVAIIAALPPRAS